MHSWENFFKIALNSMVIAFLMFCKSLKLFSLMTSLVLGKKLFGARSDEYSSCPSIGMLLLV